MRRNKLKALTSALLFGTCLTLMPTLAKATGPAINIDVSSNRHPISQYIYGMAAFGVDQTFQKNAKLPVTRWGGDAATRYNWQVDSSNAGFDWYFMSGNGVANPVPSNGADALVTTNQATGTQTLLTIPIIPFINNSSAWACSFPVSVYGPQQSVNPYVHPNNDDCGNSLTTTGTQLTDNNILMNNMANTPAFQAQWVQHLTSRFGLAKNNGVRFYQMDNEPFGWANTHRDVQPVQPTYEVIESLTEQYAAAVKGVDGSSQILGPSDFGWAAYVGNQAEINQHNGIWNAPWYLSKMAAYKAKTGVQLIDYFDEHYYPAGPTDDASILSATRALWDSTYIDQSWIGQWFGAIRLIPRMKEWVAQYNPGIKTSISEYSFGAGDRIVGALAESDALGIFGREGLDFACMWYVPKPTDPISFSFMLYRNYDGIGHGFGTTSVAATSADQSSVSVYGALRGSALTVSLINKTANDIVVPLTLANSNLNAWAKMFSYSGSDLTGIHKLPSVHFVAGVANVTLPAMSMNMLEIPTLSK